MKIYQCNFKEKKMKRSSEGVKSVSYSSEKKTIIITIVLALVIMSALLVNLAFFTSTETENFSMIYYLDSEKQLENIPRTVVLSENNTFLLWVGVENQNDIPLDYRVNVTIRTSPFDDSSVEQTESFERTVADGEIWEFPVTIRIDQLGNNKVFFELWFFDKMWVDTGNWVNLSIVALKR